MHQSTYLYRNFHSVHHRLYVPYAFGALYNHPVEGFLLDTAGAAFASYMAGLSTREEILLFAISSFKTVDDHCGYKIPWDPFQIIWGNNAECWFADKHGFTGIRELKQAAQTTIFTISSLASRKTSHSPFSHTGLPVSPSPLASSYNSGTGIASSAHA